MVVLKIAFLLCCSAAAIHGSNEIVCDLEDTPCTTAAANANWPAEVNGIGGPSSEPVVVPVPLSHETPKLQSQLDNAKLIGLSKCTIPYLSNDLTKETMDYNIHCDHIRATADFKLVGTIGEMPVDGSGSLTADRYDCLITVKANCKSYTGDDGQFYFAIDTYNISPVCSDKTVYDLIYDNDTEKSEKVSKYLSENSPTVDEEIGTDTLIGYMNVCVENSAIYTKSVSAKNQFTYSP